MVVVPIPGPCALSTAISAAGLNAATFVFLGFLPRQPKARRETLLRHARESAAIIVYEAPHRVADTVAELATCFDPQRDLIVARELTKTFETITRLPLAEAPAWFAAEPNRQRGEFVLIVDVLDDVETVAPTTLDANGEAWLVALLAELPPARAARVIAARLGIARELVYARALALKPGQPDTGGAQDR
jgi:16S rRNA (cytidine1402-2'-O)-methyltransferase